MIFMCFFDHIEQQQWSACDDEEIFNQPERRQWLDPHEAPVRVNRVNRWTRRNRAMKDYLNGKEVEL